PYKLVASPCHSERAQRLPFLQFFANLLHIKLVKLDFHSMKFLGDFFNAAGMHVFWPLGNPIPCDLQGVQYTALSVDCRCKLRPANWSACLHLYACGIVAEV